MKKLIAALCFGATMATPALAGQSMASFAYTHRIGNTVSLTVNGATTLFATQRGWVDETGANNFGGAGGNYLVGLCGSSDNCGGGDTVTHNYFVFDVAGLNTVATSAVLNLSQPGGADPGFVSSTPSLLYTLWDSSVAGATMPGKSGIAFFDDLGSGVSFGSVNLTAATNGTTVSFALNSAGLAALNASSGLFGFGGAISAGAAVPEPASWMLMIAGFGLAGGLMRRRVRMDYRAA